MAEKILSSDYSDLCQHLQTSNNAVMVRIFTFPKSYYFMHYLVRSTILILRSYVVMKINILP